MKRTVPTRNQLKYWKSKVGSKLSEEVKKKISNSKIGFKHSEETKEKIGTKNRGRIKTIEEIEKNRLSQLKRKAFGKKSSSWKGNLASYASIHIWVARHLGYKKECCICHTTKNTIYDWANIDHKYKRNLKYYIRLCRKCHEKFDKVFNNKYKKTVGVS
jgi:hypothetical protein